MRKYYSIEVEPFPRVEGSTKLDQLAKRFNSKHFWLTELQIKCFLGPQFRFRSLYLYCENDCVYEFFTGILIGKMQHVEKVYDSHFTYSFAGDMIIDSNYFEDVHAVSIYEEDFVNWVKESLPYRHQIKVVLNEYLSLHRSIKESKAERLSKMADKRSSCSKQATEQVNRILDKRR